MLKDNRINPVRKSESSLPYIILRQWIEVINPDRTKAERSKRKHLQDIYSNIVFNRITNGPTTTEFYHGGKL